MKKGALILVAVFIALMLQATAWSQEITLPRLHQDIQAKGALWEAGETSMSKLSPGEQKRRLGTLRSPNRGQGRVLSAASVSAPHTLSPSLDWRNNGGNYVSGVRDQGSCGSCWAFAATAALESATMINNKQPNTDLNLAEQVALSCSGAGNCATGGYLNLVSDFFRTTGLPVDTCYPYTGTDGTCATACPNWQASAYKLQSWSWVIDGQTASVDTIKGALADHGPLIVTMNVYDDFFSYKSGIYAHVSGTLAGGHAILLVGYDDANQCFIVKNSWGTGWGEAGFFRIAYTEVTGAAEFGYETIAYHNNTSPAVSTDFTISKLFAVSGGTASIRLTTGTGCAWTATSGVPWITISKGASGSGAGTVQYTVQANTGAQRTGSITVQGQAYTITQAGTTQAPRVASGR